MAKTAKLTRRAERILDAQDAIADADNGDRSMTVTQWDKLNAGYRRDIDAAARAHEERKIRQWRD